MDDAANHLRALLATSVSGSLEDDVLNTSGQLRALRSRAQELPTNLAAAMSRKVQLQTRYDSLYAQADEISQQFKSSDQDEIQRLGRSREKFMADIETYQVERGMNVNQIETLNKEIEDSDKAIVKAQKAEKAAELMGRRVELAQRAADALDAIYQAFAEDRRQKIEAEAQRIFQSLVWKDSHFQGMRLDRDYKLEVFDHWGQPARPELSAGERQVLSLAFITAMAKVSGEEAPLVMDTPFGRLSSAHRDNITANIPQIAPQLILFVTDEELRGQALENLKPRIGAEYHLVFDHPTSCTTIEEER
jgi:DNA sulfur modification protein DndD